MLLLIVLAPALALGTAVRPTPHAARLWHALLPSCDIVYHIHIPKTGGSSIAHVLMNATGFAKVGARYQAWPWYDSHGRHASDHWWASTDYLQLARQTRSKVIVTSETGIDDLVAGGYPSFENTCFFSVIREPREWLVSAENHMRVRSKYAGGFNGTFGYFDRPNIQSNMVGLKTRARGVVMCISTVGFVRALLAEFSDAGLPLDNVGHYESAKSARVAARAKSPRALEVAEVVRKKYALDVELWDVVSRRDVQCW